MNYPNLNEEKKLWRRGYKLVAGIDEVGRGCERPDAEILTKKGWKFYFDVNLKDKVLSYNSNGYMQWQTIERIVEKDFDGYLIELKNRSINIVATSDHYFNVLRRVFKRDKKNGNKLKLVGYKLRDERKIMSELDANDFIPRGGKWEGTSNNFFKLPKTDKNEEKFVDIKYWAAFLGIFLAEGSISYNKRKGDYKITISQSRDSSPKKYKKIWELLEKLPFHFNHLNNGFNCCNKQLYNYLKQFGNKYTKFIPAGIKELTPDLLSILINWMLLGDGSYYIGKNRKKVSIYYTSSDKLKDDFEEILLKAGWTYHTSKRPARDRYIGSRLIKKENQIGCFEIRLRRNNKAHIKYLHKKEIPYRGKVFCLQLKRHHNFFVRRNGTGYFTGNSLSGPVVAAAVIIKNHKFKINKIKDSKQLTAKRREEIYDAIINKKDIEWGIGRVSEKVIDKINILEATKLAMKKALRQAQDKLKRRADFLILDGNFGLNIKIQQKSIIKGDEKVLSCSLASIIAKVDRDRIMDKFHKKFPVYGFNKHKGYGTKLHFKMIKKYGPSLIHRKTFNPK